VLSGQIDPENSMNNELKPQLARWTAVLGDILSARMAAIVDEQLAVAKLRRVAQGMAALGLLEDHPCMLDEMDACFLMLEQDYDELCRLSLLLPDVRVIPALMPEPECVPFADEEWTSVAAA
jgi:hypothetical protein